MYLHLDPLFNPFPEAAHLTYDAFTFSGGEPHIKIHQPNYPIEEITITHRIKKFEDVGLILLATDALRRMGINKVSLFIPYFPAARQDRVMVSGEPLSVKVYANIFNMMHYENVTIFDPHSEVTAALLSNCREISNHEYIITVMDQLPQDTILISPDGGALKKIYKLASTLKNYQVIECSKSRDIATGKLSGFKVYTEDLAGRPCVIIDDICDGGGTFLGLGAALKEKGAGDLYLAVSHGIFSKGFDALTKLFSRIYTTDSFITFPAATGLFQIQLNKNII